MSAFSRKTALLLARAGALALAIGTVSWFVWNAQVRAQPRPAPDAQAEPRLDEIVLTPEEMKELMLHSSKSFSPTDITIKEDTGSAGEAPTAADPYLQSTKALFPGGALPRPPPAAKPRGTKPGQSEGTQKGPDGKKRDAQQPAASKPAPKKTDTWLPSSKSLPPQEIPLPDKGK